MSRIVLIATLLLLTVTSAWSAEETRTLKGPGLIGDNLFGVKPSSFKVIGIAPVAPNRPLKDKVAVDADPIAVETFERLSTLEIVDATSSEHFGVRRMFHNRSKSLHLLRPDKIIQAGEDLKVDAFWGASIQSYEDKRSHVKLEIEEFIYSAKTGKRIWERTFYIDKFGGGFSEAYADITEWSVRELAREGFGEIVEPVVEPAD